MNFFILRNHLNIFLPQKKKKRKIGVKKYVRVEISTSNLFQWQIIHKYEGGNFESQALGQKQMS